MGSDQYLTTRQGDPCLISHNALGARELNNNNNGNNSNSKNSTTNMITMEISTIIVALTLTTLAIILIATIFNAKNNIISCKGCFFARPWLRGALRHWGGSGSWSGWELFSVVARRREPNYVSFLRTDRNSNIPIWGVGISLT